MQSNGVEPLDVPMTAPITQTFPGDSLYAILALRSGDVELSVEPASSERWKLATRIMRP